MCVFQPEEVRMTILGRLVTLTHLDDVLLTEEEAAGAVQMAAGCRINQVGLTSSQSASAQHSTHVHSLKAG